MKLLFAWLPTLSFQIIIKNENNNDFPLFLELNETVPKVSNKDGCVSNDLEFKFNFTKGQTL